MANALALPTSVDVERLVLGCVLIDDSLLHDMRTALCVNDFSLETHRRIWNAACSLYDAGGHVDRITVHEKLRRDGQPEELSYLVSLDEGCPQLPDLSSYAGILRDQAARRRVIALGDSLMKRGSSGEPVQAILDSLGDLSLEVTPTDPSKGLVSAAQLVERVGISEILSPRVARGVPFPWKWLTNATCGMLPGELWVLAGHTSTGKSSAAIQTAVSVARTQSKAVSVFSLEMCDVSVFQRALWQVSRVDSERAKRGQMSPDERKRAGDAMNMLCDLPIHFDDGSFSVVEIHAQLRRLRSRGPLGLIVVDYLQLLKDGGRHGTRAEAVGANARMLKLLAGEFECPVLLLSQFSRDSARTKPNETPRRPELHDLKESGDIENHANGVWFIHRPSPLDADLIPVEFIVPKQREGRRNILQEFYFMPKNQRFDAKESE
jgi:replicative DNA helicase